MIKKIIYVFSLLLLLACSENSVATEESYNELPTDIFEVENTIVKDGDIANINLDSDGTYKISLIDEFKNITFTNEKFVGNRGSNRIRIYTKTLPKGSYKVHLKKDNNTVIKKTTIKI